MQADTESRPETMAGYDWERDELAAARGVVIALAISAACYAGLFALLWF